MDAVAVGTPKEQFRQQGVAGWANQADAPSCFKMAIVFLEPSFIGMKDGPVSPFSVEDLEFEASAHQPCGLFFSGTLHVGSAQPVGGNTIFTVLHVRPVDGLGRAVVQRFEVGDLLEVVPARRSRQNQGSQRHRSQARPDRGQFLRAFVVSPRHFTVISLPSSIP